MERTLHRRRSRGGFTLLELLVVVAILTLLTGMLMPMVTQARRSALRTQTKSIMAKTESALHMFKSDFHGYPYQQSYADTEPGADWTNTLNYSLGTSITAADAANVRADIATAVADYTYTLTAWLNNNSSPIVKGAFAFTENRKDGLSAHDYAGSKDSDLSPVTAWQPLAPSDPTWYLQYPTSCNSLEIYGTSLVVPACVLLNRMAGERAADLMLIGAVGARGQTMLPASSHGLTHPGRDLATMPLVADPKSAARPGWATDYLQGEIEAAHISGDAILDSWRHPLIYVCQVLPGCETACGQILGQSVDISNTTVYGLEPSVTGELPQGDNIPGGRQPLQPCYQYSNTPMVGDAYLPDTSNMMHSDRRYWAAPGLQLEFELWSAGPDGQFGWWRDDPANRDNIPCEPYDANVGIQP